MDGLPLDGGQYRPRRKNRNQRAKKPNVRRCYCEGHCPNDEQNGTCEVRHGGQCFTAIEELYDPDTNTFEPEITYGCLPADEGGMMQCKGTLVPHLRSKSIECCAGYDQCNRDLRPAYSPRTTTERPFEGADSLPYVVLLTSVTACIVIFLLIVAVIYLRYQRRDSEHRKGDRWYCDGSQGYMDKVPLSNPRYPSSTTTTNSSSDQSSGSGSGLPILVQRTISKQLEMVRAVGKGRYGEVWLARWRGQRVAAKLFFTTEEASWFREMEVYQTVLMRHENILGFIAADIRGTGSVTQMLLITDYHELGSLYDYLQSHVLDGNDLARMATSLASGLSHLHTEIFGTRGKPAIAHRDIKSKNILVKSNRECAIADFGLAVKYTAQCTNVVSELDTPTVSQSSERSGTRRYMAPEVLSGRLLDGTGRGGSAAAAAAAMDAHKAADMYSVALVMWEMGRRTMVGGGEMTSASEYQVPYYDCVPSDPTFEDMQLVVCVKNIRPEIPQRWETDEMLRTLSKVMQECWHSNPAVRLSALRVKKTLSTKMMVGKTDSQTRILV